MYLSFLNLSFPLFLKIKATFTLSQDPDRSISPHGSSRQLMQTKAPPSHLLVLSVPHNRDQNLCKVVRDDPHCFNFHLNCVCCSSSQSFQGRNSSGRSPYPASSLTAHRRGVLQRHCKCNVLTTHWLFQA